MSPALLLAGPHQRRSHGVIFKLKKRGNATFLVLHPHLQNAFTKPLQNPGLGQKKVVFSSKGSFVDAKEKLESVYPKLKDAGGFELLRMGSPNAKLFLINPPAAGYWDLARHWPTFGHSKCTLTRQWVKVLSCLSRYVFPLQQLIT